METPQLIALNLILLMLVFVVNVKVNAGILLDTQPMEFFMQCEGVHR
jgi:hypothetical protein